MLPRNPVDSVSRLHQPKRTPTALTPAEVNAVRAVIKVWEQTRGTCGPNPDGQLSQTVEVMLGGIDGVHPHMFRRTVATVINEQASVNLAAELLGHTDPKVTGEHYIRRNEHVNPPTAELLDAAFAPNTDLLD